MKQNIRGILLIRFLFFMIMIFGSSFASISYAEEVLIIANNSVGESTLTKAELKKIYIGVRVKWADGSKIFLTTLKKKAIHKTFTKKFVQKNSSQFRMYWKKMVFTGKGKSPKTFSSEADMVKYISETEGAIGYISSGTSADGVKTMTVSDK